ncbi:hypothetical protein WG66_012898 [Moniliophthora roreri]|nr:hypothetical protein WG66_012898 [Moniliophthora roreri]
MYVATFLSSIYIDYSAHRTSITLKVLNKFSYKCTSNESPNRQNGQRERRILYHDDSGWRPPPRAPSDSDGGTSTSVLEMPPRYDAAL